VTTVPVFGQTVLGPLLAAFQARHPALQIELRFTARRIDLLREDIDLAFRITDRPPEDCIAQPVLRFAVGAYATPGLKPKLRRPEDLARARCLVFGAAAEAQTLHWMHDTSGERASVEVRPCMSADDLGTLQAAARAGAGIVFTPDFAVRDELARGTLVEVLPGWRLPIPEGDTVQALTLPLAVAPEAARALVRFVADALPH
jgi:DNA-binding transcriptional LysR family regulator